MEVGQTKFSMVEAVYTEPTEVVRVEKEVRMVVAVHNKEPTSVVRVEKEVSKVEAMHKEPTAVVRVEGERQQFGVGSVLSPLFFIMVMNLISGKVSEQNELKKILYADDIVVVADTKEELQKTLREWNNIFGKHGIRMNPEKTEVMWIGERVVDLRVVVGKKTIPQ